MNYRNQSLDVLRGVAILMVIGFHALYWQESLLHNRLAIAIAEIGWSGVDLFFVLSGFLISGLLFDDYRKNGSLNLKRFWFRRAFKILPPLYVFLGTEVILISIYGLRVPWKTYAGAALFFYNYLPLQDKLLLAVDHTWTLCVEEHFYLSLPLLLLLLSRRSSWLIHSFSPGVLLILRIVHGIRLS